MTATTADLEGEIRGSVVKPGDPDYDEARSVYNAMHDRRPRLILQPANAGDVIAAVSFARESGLLLAVRGGGHNVAGFGTVEGGLVLDLSRMRSVRVDPRAPGRPAPKAAPPGATSTMPRTPSVLPRRAASSRPPASPVSPSAAGLAT